MCVGQRELPAGEDESVPTVRSRGSAGEGAYEATRDRSGDDPGSGQRSQSPQLFQTHALLSSDHAVAHAGNPAKKVSSVRKVPTEV